MTTEHWLKINLYNVTPQQMEDLAVRIRGFLETDLTLISALEIETHTDQVTCDVVQAKRKRK